MNQRAQIIKPGLFSKQASADTRRIEFDCKNEVVITNKVPVEYVFIGDSITHMWELNSYFGHAGVLILNRGIGGDTTEYLLKRFEADVIQLHPKYCVMMIGVNDTQRLEGDPWTGTPGEKREIIEEQMFRNVSEIVDLAGKFGQKLVVCSIIPINMNFINKNIERNELIACVNERIKCLCAEKNCIYVDYHARMVGADGKTLADGLTQEGLHPHVTGYNIMAEVLRETLSLYGIGI